MMRTALTAAVVSLALQTAPLLAQQQDSRSAPDRIRALPDSYSNANAARWNAELDRLRKTPVDWPALATALSSTDQILADRAATMLTCLGHGRMYASNAKRPPVNLSSLLPVLLHHLDHPRQDVRARTAEVVGALGARGEPAVPALMRMVEGLENDALNRGRVAAAEALGEIGPAAKAAVAALQRAHRLEDISLRMAAQQSLIQIAGVAAVPSTPPPGGIELLPRWSHRDERGIDTRVGVMWRDDGLEIGYDIGDLAGHHAADTDRPFLWTKKQIVHGYPVQITLRTNGSLEMLFFGDAANFSARPKNERDLAEVLLIVLSYRPTLSDGVSGLYSNAHVDPPANPQMEVTLGVHKGGYYAMVRVWGSGTPDLPIVVPVEGTGDRVEFTVSLDGKPHRFSGELKNDRLAGTFGDRPVVLRRVGGG